MDWVERPQNYKGLYGILQLLQGSHLDNFLLKTLKLCWVTFPRFSISNQYKKLVPVLSRFCNGLFRANCPIRTCVLYLLFYDSSSANADPVAGHFWSDHPVPECSRVFLFCCNYWAAVEAETRKGRWTSNRWGKCVLFLDVNGFTVKVLTLNTWGT